MYIKICFVFCFVFCFFFNDTATTEIYTLSLHDALPISMLLIYNASKGIAVYNLEGESRDTGAQSLDAPTDFSGDNVEAFMAFISEDGSQVSDSVYVGSVSVA